ncbi:MAG: hypothetical protein LBF95_09835, partial [Treponema sp.]|nr:hypothetical protein [Treponema sp.]
MEMESVGEAKVWALFREVAERQAETALQMRELSKEADRRQAETALQMRELSKEADRRQAETALQMRETDRKMRETDRKMQETDRKMQETDRIVKELSKNIGGLHNAFGKWAEELVSAKLWEKFNEMGYKFTHGGPRKFWEGSRTVAQVDMLLENG